MLKNLRAKSQVDIETFSLFFLMEKGLVLQCRRDLNRFELESGLTPTLKRQNQVDVSEAMIWVAAGFGREMNHR